MIESNAPGAGSDTAKLLIKLQSLRALVDERVREAERKRRRYLFVGITVCLVVVLCLGNVTRLNYQLDAQALAQIGRQHVEKNLPGGREGIRAYLEAQAPQLVTEVLRVATGSISSLRPAVVEQLSTHTRELTMAFEARVGEEMALGIRESKARVDEAFPNATDQEKLAKLVSTVAAQYDINVREAIEALYPQFSEEMRSIQDYVETLRTKDESLLTPKEKIQKQIIQTLLRIAVHENARPG